MGADREALAETAARARGMGDSAALLGQPTTGDFDPSIAAFEAVQAAIPDPEAPARPQTKKPTVRSRRVSLADGNAAQVVRGAKGVRFELGEGGFADWMEQEAGVLLNELYQRWQDERG